MVAPEIKANGIRQGDKFTIGINLSPLSIRYTDHPEKEAIRAQAKTIEGLIKAFDARIVLIPHVVCGFNEGDDDCRYLRKIQQAIAPEYQEAVTYLDSDIGFVGTKKELIKCDLIIAALVQFDRCYFPLQIRLLRHLNLKKFLPGDPLVNHS